MGELMPLDVIHLQAMASQPKSAAKPRRPRSGRKVAAKSKVLTFGETTPRWNLEQPKTHSRCKDGLPKVTWLSSGNEHVGVGVRRQREQSEWQSFSTPESLIVGTRPRRSESSIW